MKSLSLPNVRRRYVSQSWSTYDKFPGRNSVYYTWLHLSSVHELLSVSDKIRVCNCKITENLFSSDYEQVQSILHCQLSVPIRSYSIVSYINTCLLRYNALQAGEKSTMFRTNISPLPSGSKSKVNKNLACSRQQSRASRN
jgi:hypothetical protein